MENMQLGLIDNWLRHVQDVMHNHEASLAGFNNDAQRLDRLCELNVIEQVLNVSRTTIVQNAWSRGQELAVHGWIYGIEDGLLRDLGMCITNQVELMDAYDKAVRASV
jgi:carbonic anhydrase